jgi:hypothetical protein
MNVVNTRTNILCIHSCHTRTNHKKISHDVTHISHAVTHVLHAVTHVFYTLLLLYFKSCKYSLLKKHHQSKTKFECQMFLRKSMHSCMRTCNKFSWGDVRTQKCHIFIHLSLHYSLHFIVPLTFHHTIFINTFGFHIIVFHFIHFSIISEFVIKY